MAYVKAEPFKNQFEDINGNPLSLGTIEFYIWNGTTPTPYYTDSIGTSGGTSLTLNTLGKPTNDIFYDQAVVYKIVTKDAAGTIIDTLGPFYPSATAASSTTLIADLANTSDTAKGDALIGVKYPYAGALALTQHVVNNRDIWLDGFTGFDSTGATVSDAAFASALTALAAIGGGRLNIPKNSYIKLSTQLITNYPVLLVAGVRGDISSNTNGSGITASRPIIQWTGAAGGYMFTVKPASVGDVVWGGGSIGIEWDGNALAAAAVKLDNTKFATFDGKVRSTTYAGVVVDSTSGAVGNFSQQNTVDLEFIWGVAVACQGTHGLVLGGNGSTVPATQQQIRRVTGLIYNGSGIRIAETDNCYLGFVNVAVQAGGTGCALEQVNAGFGPPNHTLCGHLVGPVKNDNGILGPHFLHYNSESGGITQTAGSSIYSGDLVDYSTGRFYQSHKYALRRKLSIPAAAFLGGATAGTNLLASQWSTLTWPETGGDVDLSAIIPDPYELDNGFIDAIELFYAPIGTSNGTIRMVATISTSIDASGASIVTPDGSVTATLNTGVQYLQVRSTMTFASPIAYTKGDTLLLNLKRKSADAADTQTGDIAFLGARILYRSSGPNSVGSGTYYIPTY